MNQNFWKYKKVFITGSSGFKGTWLRLMLDDMGAVTLGYSDELDHHANLFNNTQTFLHNQNVQGDILDHIKLSRTISNFQPDIAIHLAAQPIVRYSYDQPINTFNNNVMGTVHFLDACRSVSSIRVLINATTDKVYENDETGKYFDENDRLGGQDPYSASKACSELVTASYITSYKLNCSTVRAGNIIGGGDISSERLMPDIYRAMFSNANVQIRNPNSVRPWQHVLDGLSGYLELIEKMWENPYTFCGGWNFGPDPKDQRSVGDIVRSIQNRNINLRAQIKEDTSSKHEAKLLMLSTEKAKSLLGWQPKLNAETSLSWTMDWYEDYLNGSDPYTLAGKQIQKFKAL